MRRFLFFKLCAAVLLASICCSHAQAAVTLNSANFPDANFRAALTAATGVNEGEASTKPPSPLSMYPTKAFPTSRA